MIKWSVFLILHAVTDEPLSSFKASARATADLYTYDREIEEVTQVGVISSMDIKELSAAVH